MSPFSWWRQFRAKQKKVKQLRACKEDGHFLVKSGEAVQGKMVGGVPTPISDKADFWFYSCKCGYGEANDPNKFSYRRSWEEAEKLKRHGTIGGLK